MPSNLTKILLWYVCTKLVSALATEFGVAIFGTMMVTLAGHCCDKIAVTYILRLVDTFTCIL